MSRRYIGRGSHQVTGLVELLTTFASSGTLKRYGINQIVGSTGIPSYNLPDPIRGQRVTITAGLCATDKTAIVVPGTTSVYFASSGTTVANLRKLTFSGANDTVSLAGMSTVRWVILSNVGSVTIGTT